MSGRIAEFHQRACDVLAISTDPIETHERWLALPPTEGGIGVLHFPLASDPIGSVCRSYGVYVEQQNLALRGLYIIDPNGVLQYQVVHALSVGRSSEEVLRVLDGLQSGGLCPGERQLGQPPLEVLSVLGVNRVIGQYRIEATLGTGSFGTVFRAHDSMLDRTVALKVLRSGGSLSLESLLAEARAAAALNHPNVCLIYAVDTSYGSPMIVMEHVEGQPLSVRLESGGLPEATAWNFARQIAKGMAAAHDAGVVHGDLKPANLMVKADGTIKIMDFGLARRVGVSQSQAETLLWTGSPSGISGTPQYMAPEQARGEFATPQSDVFAMGLILYEMLTGKAVLRGNNLLEVLKHVQQFDPASYLAELDEAMARILRGLLDPDPGQRITMDQLVNSLA